MPNYAVQMTLKTSNQNPADYVTNSWSFEADDLTALDLALDALEDFYNTIDPLYSESIVQNGHELKAYNRADPTPRAPVIERTFNFTTAPSGDTLPHEVAVVMSFQGQKQSGVPQARQRGRVFIGPIDQIRCDSDGRPSAQTRTTLTGAGQDLLDASQAATTWIWDVWSTVNGLPSEVNNGWVDNAFDTQRRRGRVSTSRNVFN